MRGVLGPAVELWTFGSPGGLQIPNFSKCWASPPHLAQLGLRQDQIPAYTKDVKFVRLLGLSAGIRVHVYICNRIGDGI